MNEKIEAGDLSDAVRIPLHELQADIDYLIGRVVADGSCAPMIATSIKTKLAALEAALPPMRAREEIARAAKALRYLADNPRPIGGQQQFNAEDLIYLSDALSRTQLGL